MAIQLPTLKPINPTAPESAGRTNVDVPDLGRAVGQQSAAANQLGNQVVDYVQKIENEAADTEATKRTNEYEQSFRSRLYGSLDGKVVGAKFQEGNPAEIYKTFDEEMAQEFERLTGDENLSGRARDLTMKRLTEKSGQLELQKLTEYGYQNAKYEDGITSSAIDLEKVNLNDAASFVREDQPDSLAMFDQTIGRIRNLRLRNGMKTGGVAPDENGNTMYVGDDGVPTRVSVSSTTNLALRKDLSDGIYNAIDNAVKTGNLSTAKILRERYGQYIEPIKSKALTEDFETADIKDQAYKAASEARRSGTDKALANLKPEVREKALQIIDDDQRRMENIKERYSKYNYNTLMNHVNERMRSDEPYSGMSDLERDPLFNNTINRITDPKQKQAVYDAVVIPKQSSDSAKKRVNDILFGRDPETDPRTMSEEDWSLAKSGLSRVDRNRADARRASMMGETNAQVQSRYKQSGKELEDQMIAIGYIKRDSFNRISGKEEIKKIEAENEFMDYLDANSNGPMTPKEIKDAARNFAVSKKTGESVKPVVPQERFRGTTRTIPKAPSNQLIKGKTRLEWAREFKVKNGRLPNMDTRELQNFINDQD